VGEFRGEVKPLGIFNRGGKGTKEAKKWEKEIL